ncbi:MAG: Ig-like domain-containing protein, partial [Candidatus Bathyarchaeota archaeon]|nr:Ig-like domain-containing protein [Candidatus Bathyarchaeota archaeon]
LKATENIPDDDETSIVQFLIKDTNGDPVAGSQTVTMTLSGPNGGEYIGSVEGTTTLDVGSVDGYATVVLHSGTVPGPVTITATVDGTSLSTASGVIAIGGGIPSEGHFSLSTTTLNIEGFAYDGITADITARIADRYGNYNVLEGTSVSFYSECGAIDRAVNLNGQGEGSVVFRTQQPIPENVDIATGSADVIAYEQEIIADYSNLLGVTIANTNNPRDGLCTIVAVVDGEEEFTDSNANGVYDLSSNESFDDTYDDVHLDMDDDSESIAYGAEVPGVPYDSSFEDLIVDRNQNGSFDGMNDAWDSNKRISQTIKLLYTGVPWLSIGDGAGSSVSSVAVADGSSTVLYFSLHDSMFNPPISGTSLDISSDVGKLNGTTTYTYLDTS